jgi:hypothetical protein
MRRSVCRWCEPGKSRPRRLADKDGELDVARAANRELMTALSLRPLS